MAEPRKSFLEKGPTPQSATASSLYVHVPFCRKRCRYCDFCSNVYDACDAEAVIAGIGAELAAARALLHLPLATAFVGGGTPTILAPALLTALIGDIAGCCNGRTEFTVEANPNSLTDATLAILADKGVNRLSVGVQSFQDEELATLGRLHTASEAAEAIARARSAGFANISADLIYGIPGQTLGSWRNSLHAAIATDVCHMSCYCLTYPEGTAIAADLAEGRVEAMDDQLQRDCYDLSCEVLSQAGLAQYEISNFARPHRQCQHNLVYWHNGPYVGVGPAAAGYLGGRRSTNTADPKKYVKRIAAGITPEDFCESLVNTELMAETLMLMLRLTQGVDRDEFQRRFGVDVTDVFAETIDRYVKIGALAIDDERLRITPDAVFVSDTILADLLAATQP